MLVLYCFKVYRCMKKTHVKTQEKWQGRENKIYKNFAIYSNNHRTRHLTSSTRNRTSSARNRTSSTRNGYERKINYDWSNFY